MKCILLHDDDSIQVGPYKLPWSILCFRGDVTNYPPDVMRAAELPPGRHFATAAIMRAAVLSISA